VGEPGSGTADLDVDTARWLCSSQGLDVVAHVTAELDENRDPLRIGTHLRRDGVDARRAAATLGVAAARRRARTRWPDADRLLFTASALEQASDPDVSRWRARRLAGLAAVEDRACGAGGDTLAIAAAGPRVVAVDVDAARLELLRHNVRMRGLEVVAVVDDALRRPPPTEGAVHADPGRRVGGRRVRRLAEHRPSVPALLDHLEAVAAGEGVAVVLSPGVDLDDPDLPGDVELEFVQLGGDLVESVAWSGRLRGADTVRATATLLSRHDGEVVATRSRSARGRRLAVGPVGDHLLEVAPAAVRARIHDDLGAGVGARRLADRRALLTVDGEVPRSPWWRARPVETVLPARATAVRRWLAGVDEQPIELVRHGVDVDLDRFRRALGPHPGGPQGRRIELVRLDRGAVAIVTSSVGL
jgi:SAM-dependent methyltransferase